jgi:hypothetical protein
MKFSSFFHKCKNSAEIFVHSKVYDNKFIIIIFVSLSHLSSF